MPQVVLAGAPGSGKSTVARLLAAALGTSVSDTDDLIEQRAGMGVPDIFVLHGEERFRVLERQTVLEALSESRGVLALGGGAVLDEQVRSALRGQPVVWLQVGAEEAVRRVGLSGPRPVLLGNVRGQWAELLRSRSPWYEAVASWRVDTAGRSAEQVCAEIIELLGGRDG